MHWNVAIRVVHYLKGTQLLVLTLGGNPDLELFGFSDSSYADCPDTARSTMGYCFSVGSAIFSWSSCRQKTVTNSSCEAEYVTLSEASCEALWLRQFLREVQFLKPNPTVLLCDNNGAKSLSSDPTHHSHSKHIESAITLCMSTLKTALSLCGVFPVTTMSRTYYEGVTSSRLHVSSSLPWPLVMLVRGGVSGWRRSQSSYF